jgi:hypothetical protein
MPPPKDGHDGSEGSLNWENIVIEEDVDDGSRGYLLR